MNGAIDLAKAVLETLLGDRIRKLTGANDLGDAVHAAISEATANASQLVDIEARKIIAQLGLVLAVRDVADQVAAVPEAFTPKGAIPALGIETEQMPPDWHPPE